ncbi:MAG: FUSC family protein [Gluconobacter potus]|uniref:FUSC family protein n=1 Tax=Gluconobacter potus TaxID=2724927 RepID=A0ABR9YN76_9PROT|nr:MULTISPECIES: FUSC family protein [Gluconobacter]MBF0865244.1 FUSC family protein [Gluconobacter sp. R71656]MBF0869071.1 FUSC family protein [Gluconobacter sp. R75628]MBF0875064.1 FUSC family protein [Gluconobacter sp. R75629]MBF0883220.1 FUSC family protein [Gluconobacter potus]
MRNPFRQLFSFDRNSVRWRNFVSTAAFTARVFLSIGIALFLAFMIQLESPMSTVTTVLIVANPTVGALVSKSVWRMTGTVIGAALSTAVMAMFVQSAVLYFMALSAFVGLACMTATCLRYFRAYAAVLTGYTIIIVAVPAFAHPENIFLSAMMRVSDVALGIVVTAAVFMVTSPRRRQGTMDALSGAFRETIRHALVFHEGLMNRSDAQDVPGSEPVGTEGAFRSLPQTIYDGRQRLLGQLARLGPAIEYAATDNPDIHAGVRGYRLAVSRMTGLVASYHPYWRNLGVANPLSAPVHREIRDTLTELLALTENAGWIERPQGVLACLEESLERLEVLEGAVTSPAVQASVDNVRDILLQLRETVLDLSSPRGPHVRVRVLPYLEWMSAIYNGLRGVLIAFLACMIWYITYFPTGPMMIMYVVAASSLLSTAPSAARASLPMAIGTALSVPACWLCHIAALPRVDGYPMLWLSVCACMLPGVWLQFHPRYGVGAFGYTVFLAMQLMITNSMVPDDITLINTWLAILMGCALLVLVFRVIMPADQRLYASRLVISLGRSLQSLSARPAGKVPSWMVWEGTQIQKVSILLMRLSLVASPIDRQGYVDGAFAALSLGRLLIRLRQAVEPAGLSAHEREALDGALASFKTLRRDPVGTAASLMAAAGLIGADEASGMEGLYRVRLVSCLEQSAHIIDSIPGFFHADGPLHLWYDERGPATLVAVNPAR